MRGLRIVLALALAVSIVLLARWAILSNEAAVAPSRPSPAVTETAAADMRAEDVPARASAAAEHETGPAQFEGKGPSPSSFGTFRGRLVDAVTREPVREFEIAFHGMQATKYGNEAPGSRRFQSKDGRFAWDFLVPGRWTVTASSPGFQRFELHGLEVPAAAATPEIVMPMRRGHSLRGRVYDEATGAGIASARIAFREAGSGRFEGNFRMRPAVSTGKDGSFLLDGLPGGGITLEVDARGYAGRELGVVVGKNAAPLEIALSTGGSIAGRLVAADGVTPVAGTVGVLSLDERYGTGSRVGSTGDFSFTTLSPGRYRLSGQAQGSIAVLDLELAAHQHIGGIVLTLTAGRSVRGVVTGLKPDELPQTRVSATPQQEMAGSWSEAAVDERGAFVLHGVRPGRLRVFADVSMRRQVSKIVDVPPDADVTVQLDFPPGARLSGRVTRGGKPVARLEIYPRSAAEEFFSYGSRTSPEGTYLFEGLPPDEYVLIAGDYRSRPVRVVGDTVFDIDIPDTELSGRVLEESGEIPVVGAYIELRSIEPGARRLHLRGRSDHFGEFALTGLEPGEFLLTVHRSGYAMHRERLSYSSSRSGMTIRLKAENGVEIRVWEAGTGRPLDHVNVAEQLGDRHGTWLRIPLDENGSGYLPAALAGSNLSIGLSGYRLVEIRGWSGQALDLQLRRIEPQ